jgi:predicted Zn-dependent protease
MGRRSVVALVGLALVAVTSCASSGDGTCPTIARGAREPSASIDGYKVVIHPDSPAASAAQIALALTRWEEATDRTVTFVVVRDTFDPTVKPPLGELRIYVAPQVTPSEHIGSTNTWELDAHGRPMRALTWVDAALDERMTFLVALHELGHALGLGHSDGSPRVSIMRAVIADVGDRPTAYDRVKACELWSCAPVAASSADEAR